MMGKVCLRAQKQGDSGWRGTIGQFRCLTTQTSYTHSAKMGLLSMQRDQLHDPITHLPKQQGLYHPAFEHDACGVGFLCHIKGKASNKIVLQALEMLENMNHRGACGCEPDSGDGAGILVATPDKFFRREARRLGFKLPKAGEYGVAMCFLPKDLIAREECEGILENSVRSFGMTILGWRDVPTDNRHVGPTPRSMEPKVRQCFIGMGETFYNRADFNRRLYLV